MSVNKNDILKIGYEMRVQETSKKGMKNQDAVTF